MARGGQGGGKAAIKYYATPEMAERLDGFVKAKGYASRSVAMDDLISAGLAVLTEDLWAGGAEQMVRCVAESVVGYHARCAEGALGELLRECAEGCERAEAWSMAAVAALHAAEDGTMPAQLDEAMELYREAGGMAARTGLPMSSCLAMAGERLEEGDWED